MLLLGNTFKGCQHLWKAAVAAVAYLVADAPPQGEHLESPSLQRWLHPDYLRDGSS